MRNGQRQRRHVLYKSGWALLLTFFPFFWQPGAFVNGVGQRGASGSGPPQVSEYKIIFGGKEVGNERLERGEAPTETLPGVRSAKASSHVTLLDTVYRLTEEMQFDRRGELVSFSLVGDMGARKISRHVRVENGQAMIDFDGDKMSKASVPTSFVASDDTLASMNALLFEGMMKSAGQRFVVPLLPQGKARVNRRGEDIFQVDGREVRATRFFETGMTTRSSFAWLLPSGEMLVTTGVDATAFVVLAGYESILAQIPDIVAGDLQAMKRGKTNRTDKRP